MTFANVEIQRRLALDSLYQQSYGVSAMAENLLRADPETIQTAINEAVQNRTPAKTKAYTDD